MTLISHPTGNTFVRALLHSLRGESQLQFEFHTTLGFAAGADWWRIVPEELRQELARRSYELPPDRLRLHPWREVLRLVASLLGAGALLRHEHGAASVDAVYRGLDAAVARRVRRGQVQQVYAYEDGACETFRAAAEAGARRLYNLPIAYWETSRRLLAEEAQRYPDWEPTLVGTRDSAAKCERKTEELALADAVICPSEFVRQSLPEHIRATKVCEVAPFGSPGLDQPAPAATEGGALRVLFAGSLSQRKGLADLFAAMRLLQRSDVELVVMGSLLRDLDFYRERCPHFRYEPPRPHAEVLQLMRSCHVLALPSIVEGRALVQQEAMSCGLPILVTPNTGGEDLVEAGRTGFLVPIRSPEALAERIAWLADHRAALPEMSRAARARAEQVTWEACWQAQRHLFAPIHA